MKVVQLTQQLEFFLLKRHAKLHLLKLKADTTFHLIFTLILLLTCKKVSLLDYLLISLTAFELNYF